jgi:hypothetical protein
MDESMKGLKETDVMKRANASKSYLKEGCENLRYRADFNGQPVELMLDKANSRGVLKQEDPVDLSLEKALYNGQPPIVISDPRMLMTDRPGTIRAAAPFEYPQGGVVEPKETPTALETAEQVLANDPETAQDIIDWQQATYLLIGTMMVQQGKRAACISLIELERFRQNYKVEFTTGKHGSLEYRVRPLPKTPGAKNV